MRTIDKILRDKMKATIKVHAESGEPYAEMIDLIDEQYFFRFPTRTMDEIVRMRMSIEDELIKEGVLHI